MSETLTTYVISVVILAVLALFVPCFEVMAKLLRRGSGSRNAAAEPARAKGYPRKVA